MSSVARARQARDEAKRVAARAGWLRFWVLLGLAGLCVVAFNDRYRGDVLRPGALSRAHAVLEGECSRCHTAAESNPVPWMLSVLGLTADAGYQGDPDWKRCTSCHDRGADPLEPHGRPHGSLDTEARGSTSSPGGGPVLELAAARVGTAGGWRSGPVPCGACHFEHGGRDASLVQVSDHRCQVCHRERFSGFADGHPDLVDYPYRRRTRIRFDHDSHLARHFVDQAGRAPASCTDCHALAGDGSRMTSGGYDETCAACHQAEIEGAGRAGERGLAFLGWPGLDLETLRDAGGASAVAASGWWPEDADSVTTAIAWLLFAGEPEASEWLPVVRELDTYDLEDASPEQVEAVAAWATATRGLLVDLAVRGQAAVSERLERALGRPLTPGELAPLVAGLEPELGRLLLESGKDGAAPAASRQGAESIPGGGWYRSGFTLLYRPTGHADRFMTAWFELASAEPRAAGVLEALGLVGEGGPGLCTKCHSLDRLEDGTAQIQWRAAAEPAAAAPRPFTRFRHAPHFPLTDPVAGIGSGIHAGDGCFTCHELRPSGEERHGDAYAQGDPGMFTGNFRPMDKATCVRCHDERARHAAPASCVTCHRYHTASMQVRPPASPLPVGPR